MQQRGLFLIVFLDASIAQRHTFTATQTTLVSRLNSLLVLVLSWDLLIIIERSSNASLIL